MPPGETLPADQFGFKPGHAGQYHPPKTLREIRAIFQKYGEAAASTLAMLAGDASVPAVVRVMACKEILSRGYGSPGPQAPFRDEEGSTSSGPRGKLSEQDLTTMDDATLAQVLMEEVAAQRGRVG